jgi:conjugal transfer mating pair stabilization protein TraG
MFEIYAYHNTESLFGIFNAIAALVGSSTYLSAIAAVAFCGFVAAALAYAFAPEKLQGWQWLASVILVYSILFVPKVTVGIVDKTGGAPVKVVANVPFGIAMFGGLTSAIGNTLTELFETAFQAIPGIGGLSSAFTYQQHGLMFGNRLIRDTRSIAIGDPNLRTDLINFVHNCTMYDLMDGTIDPASFAKTPDAWAMMGTPNPARFTSVTGGSSVTNVTCPEAYASLSGRLPAEIAALQGRLALRLNPTLPPAVAISAIAGQVQQAYFRNQIAGAAATAADIIRQNAVINAINDSSQLIGQKINDPSSMVLAIGRAQAVAQQNAAWINGAKIAEQGLPIVRNVVEAMMYALFPIFVMLLFLTSGRETMLAVKSYVAVLIWIQLWPPLFAILNYMGTIYAQYDLAAAAEVGGGLKALSLLSASTIYSNAVSGAAIVGYLVASIPFIAWAALKRMENFGTALVGGWAALQQSVAATTSQAAVGNVGIGNVTMDQRVISPTASNPWVSRSQMPSGDWITQDGIGRTAIAKLRNEGFASRIVSVRVSEQDVAEATQAADAARSESVAAATERSAAIADIYGRSVARIRSSAASDAKTSSSYDETSSSLDRLDQIARNVSDRTGVAQSQVAQIAFRAAGHVGVGTPGISPIKAGVGVDASAGKSYSAALSSDSQKVLSALTSEQLGEFKRFGDRVARDSSFVASLASDEREGRDMSSRLAEAVSRSERADAAYAERVALAERLSAARERGETISIDIAQDPHNIEMFRRYSEQYGGNSTAALVLMESELARQALRPTRAFSDGSAAPASVSDVRLRHAQSAALPGKDVDIDQAHREHDAIVERTRRQLDVQRPDLRSTTPDVRRDVQNEGARIRSQTQGADAAFDHKSEATVDNDGTPSTRKSLLLQAGKQTVADGANTVEDAKDAVKKLLKK